MAILCESAAPRIWHKNIECPADTYSSCSEQPPYDILLKLNNSEQVTLVAGFKDEYLEEILYINSVHFYEYNCSFISRI